MEQNYLLQTKANLGNRMFAGLIDYGLIFAYMIIMMYFFGEYNVDGEYSVSGLPAFSIMLVWFGVTIGLEQSFGATIGNKLVNLKPVPKANIVQSLTFGQSIKRHLLDIFDLWPFGILGIIMIKNTQFNQRLGDLWAKTIVIDTTDEDQGLKKIVHDNSSI